MDAQPEAAEGSAASAATNAVGRGAGAPHSMPLTTLQRAPPTTPVARPLASESREWRASASSSVSLRRLPRVDGGRPEAIYGAEERDGMLHLACSYYRQLLGVWAE